jgi:hypothetical protein
MRHRIAAVLAACVLALLLPGSALAAGETLDQQNTATGAQWPGAATRGQTVTAGMTGTLTRVDLALSEQPTAAVEVSIYGVDRRTGTPIGPVEASASNFVSGDGWYMFALNNPVSLLAGGHFVIVFTLDSGGDVGGSLDNYSGGGAFQYSGTWKSIGAWDYDFKTYMMPPTPTPVPTPPPTPHPSPSLLAPGSAAATSSVALASAPMSPTVSGSPVLAVSTTPSETASPAPASPTTSTGGTDLTLPALAAMGLLLLLALAGGFLLGRRRQPD